MRTIQALVLYFNIIIFCLALLGCEKETERKFGSSDKNQSINHECPKGHIVFPDDDDTRMKMLELEIIEEVDIKNLTMDEIADRVKLAERLRSSIVIDGSLRGKKYTFWFKGGDVREFLEKMTSVNDIEIVFTEYAMIIRGGGNSGNHPQ